jgi:hypothetical protein
MFSGKRGIGVMTSNKPGIRRRSIVTSPMSALVDFVKTLALEDNAFEAFTKAPLTFAKESIKSKSIFEIFQSDEDFRELTAVVKKIRNRARNKKLDFDLLFNFADIKFTNSNYETIHQTHYNFDQSTEREMSYGRDGVSVRPGYMSQSYSRLHNSFATSLKGKGEFMLADQDFGPMLSDKLLKRLKKIQSND